MKHPYRIVRDIGLMPYKGNLYSYRIIHGTNIGGLELQAALLEDGEPRDEEAIKVDEQFGYYIEDALLNQPDEAIWSYIKTEIDEDFACGESE
jgi:hypothetical protein